VAGPDFVPLAAWPIVEDDDLVALALLDDGRPDFGPADSGPADLDATFVGHEQDIIELNRVADLLRQNLNAKLVADAGTELLSADF
jgi:hypothetical protein